MTGRTCQLGCVAGAIRRLWPRLPLDACHISQPSPLAGNAPEVAKRASSTTQLGLGLPVVGKQSRTTPASNFNFLEDSASGDGAGF